jgi:parallel beta-helix repeat protein
LYNKKLTIRGGYTKTNWNQSKPLVNITTLDAEGKGMVFYITYKLGGSGNITLDGLHMTGGKASDNIAGGGAVLAEFTYNPIVVIQNSVVYSNTAEKGAGGIAGNFSDGIRVLDCTIRGNTGDGVLILSSDNPTVTGNRFENNSDRGLNVNTGGDNAKVQNNTFSGNQDSGMYWYGTRGIISGNTFTGNYTEHGGGGLKVKSFSDLVIQDNRFIDNVADIRGGGLNAESGIGIIKNNLVQGNSAPLAGGGSAGGIYVYSGETGHITVTGNTVISNTTWGSGGGMQLAGRLYVTGNTVRGNSGYGGGGIDGNVIGSLNQNQVYGNSARFGGGIKIFSPLGMVMDRNVVVHNTASEDGGGFYLTGTWNFDALMDGNQVISNTATSKGGGIYIEGPHLDESSLAMTNTLVVDNRAGQGGGIYLASTPATLVHTTVAGNRGSGDGVGVYIKYVDTGSVNMLNSIIAGQTTGVYVWSGSSLVMGDTLWGAGDWANDAETGGAGSIDIGTNNYTGDPLFLAPGSLDFHITGGSPARDKGSDAGVTTDMDAEIRPHADTGVPDLGADEFHLDDFFIYLPLIVR